MPPKYFELALAKRDARRLLKDRVGSDWVFVADLVDQLRKQWPPEVFMRAYRQTREMQGGVCTTIPPNAAWIVARNALSIAACQQGLQKKGERRAVIAYRRSTG